MPEQRSAGPLGTRLARGERKIDAQMRRSLMRPPAALDCARMKVWEGTRRFGATLVAPATLGCARMKMWNLR